MSARQNSQWMSMVTRLLSDGLGVEDIAQRLGCEVSHVRREVEIRRADGGLQVLYKIARTRWASEAKGARG